MTLKFTDTYTELKNKLSSLNGEWSELSPNKKVFKYKDGLMNWFETTGTISFQGKSIDKEFLESKIPALLYPSENVSLAVAEPLALEAEIEAEIDERINTIENKYLTKGINDGELIIGIVSAVGTEYSRVISPLRDRLSIFGYEVEEVRVSSILASPQDGISEYERIKHYMNNGDQLRKESGLNGALATGAAKIIQEKRKKNTAKQAYIINSLKHPREVELLRKIYGDGFYLIGIHNDEKRRHKYLTDDKGLTHDEANELIKIDEDESIDYGQKTRDTYHLSDFFLNLDKNDDKVKNRLQRFLELIFSHPNRNPTFDEFAMFMAFNSAARSSDLSRQVGAVVSRDNQIIATGANDVPKSGGGQYWAQVDSETGEIKDFEDGKDQMRGEDSNKKTQLEIIDEIIAKLTDSKLINTEKAVDLKSLLKESKISDLTEFGRVVHAEMDALLSCSRLGISTKNSTLYCTTFPCHNCAKHIIASGVHRVVYVEPYPKSRALDFHSESVKLNSELDGSSEDCELVIFEPFIGVGPRRFLDLFSMNQGRGSKLKRKDKEGKILDWDKSTAPIRTPLIPKSYLEVENAAVEMWDVISAQ